MEHDNSLSLMNTKWSQFGNQQFLYPDNAHKDSRSKGGKDPCPPNFKHLDSKVDPFVDMK